MLVIFRKGLGEGTGDPGMQAMFYIFIVGGGYMDVFDLWENSPRFTLKICAFSSMCIILQWKFTILKHTPQNL